MNIIFVDGKKPTKTNRSKRLEKKLHIESFAVTMLDITFKHNTIAIPNDSTSCYDYHDAIMDALYDANIVFDTFGIYEHNDEPSYCLATSRSELNILVSIPTKDYSVDAISTCVSNIQKAVKHIITDIETPSDITVMYGDAYYGNW